MKSSESPRGAIKGEWRPSSAGEMLPDSSPRAGASCSSGASLPDLEATRAFLHQWSQTLTALRGTLELGLLADSDAQDYRRTIEQSLRQAETLFQLFKSYRAIAQGAENRPRE